MIAKVISVHVAEQQGKIVSLPLTKLPQESITTSHRGHILYNNIT